MDDRGECSQGDDDLHEALETAGEIWSGGRRNGHGDRHPHLRVAQVDVG